MLSRLWVKGKKGKFAFHNFMNTLQVYTYALKYHAVLMAKVIKLCYATKLICTQEKKTRKSTYAFSNIGCSDVIF